MKRGVNLAGSVFAILIMSVVLYFYGGDLSKVDLANPALLSGLVGSAALYVVVILIGAFGWRILLTAFGAAPAPWAAERQLLISQIGKYIPGNIAQYLGRAAMTINSGVPAKIVGVALVTETATILVGGFLSVAISITFAPGLAGSLVRVLPDGTELFWIAGAAVAFLILLVGASFVSTLTRGLQRLPKAKLGGLLLVTLFSTTTFLLLGVSLHLIVGALSTAPVPISLSVAVFAAAWIAGLATPGAPGGLGVRESVLTLGLAPAIGGPAALSAALLHRGVSVLGDAISFGIGQHLPNKGKEPFAPGRP